MCKRSVRIYASALTRKVEDDKPQKRTRGLKIRIKEAKGMYYQCSENKGCAFGFAYAKIRFSHDEGHFILYLIINEFFSTRRSKFNSVTSLHKRRRYGACQTYMTASIVLFLLMYPWSLKPQIWLRFTTIHNDLASKKEDKQNIRHSNGSIRMFVRLRLRYEFMTVHGQQGRSRKYYGRLRCIYGFKW